MKRLLEPIKFFDKDFIIWNYNICTTKDYKNYYHWHQCCEIMFVHDGNGTIILNQQSYNIKRGMFFFFQPFQLHHIHADVSEEVPFIRSIFYVDPLFIENLLSPFPKKHKLFSALWKSENKNIVFNFSNQSEILDHIYYSYNRNFLKGTSETEDLLLLLLQILNEIEILHSNNEVFANMPIKNTLRYSEIIMQWIETHYAEEVTLKQIAAEAHLSLSYISRIFRKETGSNITDYLTARRIREACLLLNTTDLSVEQIGIKVGIPNASYFNQIFKGITKTTPLKYRNKR
jgi:YesN/AraC family two-component response regulator